MFWFLHFLKCFGQFLHVLTCSEQKSGRSIFGVFFKHVIESRDLMSQVKNRSAKLDVFKGCARNALRTGFYMFLHVLLCFGRFLHVLTCLGQFLHVLTCSEQKTGRPIFGVIFKHVIESRDLL